MAATRAIGRGEIVVLVDDGVRSSGGFLIMSAARCRPSHIGVMRRFGSGVVAAPMSAARAAALDLPRMPAESDALFGSAFTVAVDAAEGITTGISAEDRARTLRVLADPASGSADLVRPGHIFPLRSRPGGVLERAGPTEAAVELAELAGLAPVAVGSELLTGAGDVASIAFLRRFAARHRLALVTIRDLIARRLRAGAVAGRAREGSAETSSGRLRMVTYELADGREHLALVGAEDIRVYVRAGKSLQGAGAADRSTDELIAGQIVQELSREPTSPRRRARTARLRARRPRAGATGR